MNDSARAVRFYQPIKEYNGMFSARAISRSPIPELTF